MKFEVSLPLFPLLITAALRETIHRWESWVRERSNVLSKATQPIGDKAGNQGHCSIQFGLTAFCSREKIFNLLSPTELQLFWNLGLSEAWKLPVWTPPTSGLLWALESKAFPESIFYLPDRGHLIAIIILISLGHLPLKTLFFPPFNAYWKAGFLCGFFFFFFLLWE